MQPTPLLVCSFGTLASGATATLGIVGTPGAIGLLGGSFTIQADEDDPVPANNAVAVNTAVVGGPSSFIVANTNDAGAGSLRQAILTPTRAQGRHHQLRHPWSGTVHDHAGVRVADDH